MFHDHTCNYYLVKFSDMTLQRPGDAEEMQSLINCRIHVFSGNTQSMTNSCTQSYNKLYMGFLLCSIITIRWILHFCETIEFTWLYYYMITSKYKYFLRFVFCQQCQSSTVFFPGKKPSWQPRCTTFVVPNQANTWEIL